MFPRTRLAVLASATAAAATAALLSRHTASEESGVPRLSPAHFTPSTLIDSVPVSPNSRLLTLSVPPDSVPRDLAPIWSIFIKDSDIQVERPYTPLGSVDENGHIKLWVKMYDNGQVSRWLHSRRVGDEIEIRGPVPTWSRHGHWDHVLMISGGTGITPFYQLLHSVFESTSPNTRFTLLHASRSIADLPPPTILDSLAALSQKHPDLFQVRLFTESVDGIPQAHSHVVQCGRIGKSAVQDSLYPTPAFPWWRSLFASSSLPPYPPDKKILVLVCGPEGMVTAIAGPYGRNYSQGDVGGVLGELGLKSHQVWKL